MTHNQKPLNGLILAGGFSRRMGQDKALIDYHGKTQIAYAYDVASSFCEKVFVSIREDQSDNPFYKTFLQLRDDPEFSDAGPLTGILSALKSDRKQGWFVLALDLPFVNAQVVGTLFQERDPKSLATAFISTSDALPEPLCAIWEAEAYEEILALYHQGVRCARKALIRLSKTHLIQQKEPFWLDNVNTPQEFEAIQRKIAQGK